VKRCATCRRRIWPWQPFGFRYPLLGQRVYWHRACGSPPHYLEERPPLFV
jgi:hypothetical protein